MEIPPEKNTNFQYFDTGKNKMADIIDDCRPLYHIYLTLWKEVTKYVLMTDRYLLPIAINHILHCHNYTQFLILISITVSRHFVKHITETKFAWHFVVCPNYYEITCTY